MRKDLEEIDLRQKRAGRFLLGLQFPLTSNGYSQRQLTWSYCFTEHPEI